MKIHVIVYHDAPYLQVPLPVLPLGYTGRFARAIDR